MFGAYYFPKIRFVEIKNAEKCLIIDKTSEELILVHPYNYIVYYCNQNGVFTFDNTLKNCYATKNYFQAKPTAHEINDSTMAMLKGTLQIINAALP